MEFLRRFVRANGNVNPFVVPVLCALLLIAE